MRTALRRWISPRRSEIEMRNHWSFFFAADTEGYQPAGERRLRIHSTRRSCQLANSTGLQEYKKGIPYRGDRDFGFAP